MKTRGATLLTVALVAALGACDSATGPGERTTMEVAVQGDGSGASSSTSTVSSTHSQSFASGSAEGTIDFRARVWIRTNTSQWVELTQSAAKRAVVDASGRQGAQTFVTTQVEARSYNRVRIEFEEVQANVTGGLFVGSGLLSGVIRVDIQSGNRATVERDIEINTEAGSTTRLVLDLNASQWLSRANAQAKTVSRAEFESAVRVFAAARNQ